MVSIAEIALMVIIAIAVMLIISVMAITCVMTVIVPTFDISFYLS